MSKYTTEVRFICESKSGLDVSGGCDDVDEIIDKSWNKIFTSKVEFFDENYRSVLCKKILKHYYLREICCETVGIWKLWLNTRLEEIMPYYNQMYESARLKIDPLIDTDYITESLYDKTVVENSDSEGTVVNNGSVEVSGNNTVHDEGENRRLYSDTPQGSVVGLEDGTYLTNATIDSNVNDSRSENSSNSREDRTVNTTDTSKNNSKEDSKNNVVTKGKMNGKSFSQMLMEFRETFLNIDMLVIDEFEDLFFGLW